MRRREPLSPEDERELDAIDRALCGEPVDHDLREFDDLVNEVRATAPQMSPALTARLERIVEHGPETDPAAAPTKPLRSRRWVLMPAFGTVTAVVVALVVVLGNANNDDNDPRSSGGDETVSVTKQEAQPNAGGDVAEDRAATPARPQSSTADPATAPATRSSAIAPARERKVEMSVLLALTTSKDKVQSTADDVNQTVARFRGIVASSSVNTNDADGGDATFDLRIPTTRLDDALAALAKLGHVSERRQDLQDITASFTSTQDRLDEARAERRGLLKALGNATSQNQIESLRARLRVVRAQLASAKSQLASLQRRADYSRVDVTIRGNAKAEQGGGGSWSPGDAANDALRVLEVIAGVALIALAIAIPLALLGLAILFGTRVARTRRRESALDAT